MKGVTFLLIICGIGVLLAAGCSGPMAGCQIVTFENKKVYQGQSIESVERSLGKPDMVSKGPYTMNMWAGGDLIIPGMTAYELVYVNNSNSLILWIEDNYVSRVGIVPTRKIKF